MAESYKDGFKTLDVSVSEMNNFLMAVHTELKDNFTFTRVLEIFVNEKLKKIGTVWEFINNLSQSSEEDGWKEASLRKIVVMDRFGVVSYEILPNMNVIVGSSTHPDSYTIFRRDRNTNICHRISVHRNIPKCGYILICANDIESYQAYIKTSDTKTKRLLTSLFDYCQDVFADKFMRDVNLMRQFGKTRLMMESEKDINPKDLLKINK